MCSAAQSRVYASDILCSVRRPPFVPVVCNPSLASHNLPPPSTPISQLHFPKATQYWFMASPVQLRHNNPSRRPRKLFKINNPSKMAWIVEMLASYLFMFLAQSYERRYYGSAWGFQRNSMAKHKCPAPLRRLSDSKNTTSICHVEYVCGGKHINPPLTSRPHFHPPTNLSHHTKSTW
jgi:hypothetical protein